MQTKIEVPFLSPKTISVAVTNFLNDFISWNGKHILPPVPVEDILEKFLGFTLEILDLKEYTGQEDVLGATWVDSQIVRIEQGLLEKEGRYAFTIAHEIGHWVLHRKYLLAAREKENTKTPLHISRTTTKKEPIEWQADKFAAMLLMPEDLIKPIFCRFLEDKTSKRKDYVEVIQGEGNLGSLFLHESIANDLIGELGFSNCSFQAMEIRVKELNLIQCITLVDDQLKLDLAF